MEYVKDCHDAPPGVLELLQQLDVVGRKLNRFIQAVERQHLAGSPSASD
jgi:hypothetical protein